ncbi:GGDEF domain-containing protein [Actinoplanes sp. DH11]|uniref:GGDEF domain-containing protein n=1 Tax=Actinoplanes sp. DH11 TaxID=2857011 RepID=UPI001E63F6D3|nr:GGDEF domain-containing protein [Actinoplanes sp. DH11]
MASPEGNTPTPGESALVTDRRRVRAWLIAAGVTSVLLLLVQAVAPGLVLGYAWIPGGVTMGLAAWVAYRVSRVGDLPPAGRFFWRRIAIAAALVTPGACLLNAINTDLVPNTTSYVVAAVAPIGVALLLVIGALLRLPTVRRMRGDTVRLGLDAATVMVVAATVLWQFQLQPMIGSRPQLSTVAGPLVLCVICLGAVLAVARLVLAGTDAVPSRALRVLALVVLIGALSSAVTRLLEHHERWRGAGPWISAFEGGLVAWAALRSYRASASAGGTRSRTQHFSLLPYAAVTALNLLLVILTVTGQISLAVVAGSVVVTALVVTRQILAFRDNAQLIDSLHEHRRMLHHQATHDSLTGLANRALFNDELATACLTRSPAVLMVDLDGFKQVNDSLGHAAGDDLLVEIARRLGAATRTTDLVARLGGDEFAILLPASDEAEAGQVAERILASLRDPVHTHGTTIAPHASIGAAAHTDGDDADTLMRRADIAMYAAKAAGKDRYALADAAVPGRTASAMMVR